MRIKVDEDLPRAVAQLICDRGHQAERVVDEKMGGWKDAQLWEGVQSERRFLVTADKGLADARAHPPGSHAGVLLLRPDQEGVHCEKPLVINPWNLDALEQIETESGRRVYTLLQLRLHPALVELKRRFDSETGTARREVVLTYVTSRGRWYDVSWKGQEDRSGGIATNIGIHFFDLLMWLFGSMQRSEVHLTERRRMAGFIELARANVRWFLSLETGDLPFSVQPGQRSTYRSITVDGQEVEFTEGFTDLHTRVYERTLAGDGFGIKDARPSIELVHQIRTARVIEAPDCPHPFIDRPWVTGRE
ncbi:MAG: DUF5615 family PIN-like protein [Acidobacteriota bacterium]